MPQIFYFAGIACLSLALLFNLLTTISLPTLHGLDFARINLPGPPRTDATQLQYGIWYGMSHPEQYTGHLHWSIRGACGFFPGHKPVCTPKEPRSAWFDDSTYGGDADGDPIILTSAWTRGLAIHPFVLILNALALVLACSKHEKAPIVASLASFITAFFALIAFAIDIAFVARVHHLLGLMVLPTGTHFSAVPGPAFWLSFLSLLLVLGAGGTAFLRHRKNRAAGGDPTMYYPSTSKPGLLGRFF
ncbi:hypothetical protein C8R43DRAFT_1170379 [Mycena crocata]|nr:hypothetical protein C8R43DRAFT_1170379 [Mycena crocata]